MDNDVFGPTASDQSQNEVTNRNTSKLPSVLNPYPPSQILSDNQNLYRNTVEESTLSLSEHTEPAFINSMDGPEESFSGQILHDTLPEVESSFAAPLSPLPAVSKDDPDDTYVFDSPTKAPMAVTPKPLNTEAHRPDKSQSDSLQKGRDLSSPSHAMSGSSVRQSDGMAVSAESLKKQQTSGHNDSYTSMPHTPTAERDASSSEFGISTYQPMPASDALDHVSKERDGSGVNYGKRPRFLKTRGASQRSSTSSFTTNPDSHGDIDSDVTVGFGIDYALQSGGAIPSLGTGRNLGEVLSRSVSLASVASTVDGTRNFSGRLNALTEQSANARSVDNEDYLQTPRPKVILAPPTDTLLTRRVMDVQVPESLEKEYKSKGALMSPRKGFESSTGTSQRPGRNMTLKEQSSTIERLSKENFDLKLKVMFLSDRLDKLSEDGIKEMIQENVEFRTNIAVLQRDNKYLRRRVKDLEKRLRDEDDRPGTSRSAASSTGPSTENLDKDAQGRDEENTFLRERLEEYSTMIERFRQDILSKEAEKRRLADAVKSLQNLGAKNASEDLGRQEEEDVWKDLLEQETARREQADEDNRKLRDEVFRLKQELHNNTTFSAGGPQANGPFNTAKRTVTGALLQTPSTTSGTDMDYSNSFSSGTNTLIEELRREGEQLRHENAELRKEVGAQTSMLTSRNKEKERLYQEIEDLKMAQRRGGPAPSTADSILDRSASQVGARERSSSRASGRTRAETAVDDSEREDLEIRNANLRDKINEAKLVNQSLLQEVESALQQKQEAEEIALGLQRDYEGAMADLMAMQTERDELITELNDLEEKYGTLQTEFEDLRVEAQEAIDGYEGEADIRDVESQKLQLELEERVESFDSLQQEMRKLSEALVGLEDETDNKLRRIQQLEQELGDANKELEELEAKLLESNDKAHRLLVQQESSQGEIAFLREEQESDKLTISRLEANISKAEDLLHDEQERVKQLQAQIITERERSESLATKDKKEMQHIVNELSREASSAREEARKLRKNLTSREVEATEWKERLTELENNLREALGDLSGTRSGLLKSIAKIQRQLEDTVRELDSTKASLLEKDRIIKQRDALLESHSLESRKVAEALDKERAAHRNTKYQFETFQKTHQHVSRTVSSQDARIVELETTKTQDKKRLSILETTFRDQLNERNNLLLVLWTKLSSLCGTDWTHNNRLINGRALPSLEAVATMLPGFSRNLMASIKHIESIIGSFQGRIKSVEKDLWREYQTLESSLELRTKKLDRLEGIVRTGIASGAFSNADVHNRMMKMEEAYRQLKVENATLRAASDVRTRTAHPVTDAGSDGDLSVAAGSPSPSIPTGPRDRATLAALRSKAGSRSGVPRPMTSSRPVTAGELVLKESTDVGSGDGYSADPRWILRLRDLENKLKLEREGRTMDRHEAARRIRDQEAELNRRKERDKRNTGQ